MEERWSEEVGRGRWEGGFTVIIRGGQATKEGEIVIEEVDPSRHY